jgi:hypothetical protein
MCTTHVVQDGECLANIASAYRFRSWKSIYNASENVELRKKRPNPNVLYAGDEVVIPDNGTKSHDRPTEQKHPFVVRNTRWVLRLCMKDRDGNAIAGEPFEFTSPGGYPVKGNTARDGMIEVELPAETRSATLRFLGKEYAVKIGKLDPIGRVKGVQARLNNLGFHAGPVDGIPGKLTRKAVYDFQASQGMKPTGQIDDATLQLLLPEHDNDSRYTPIEEDMSPREAPSRAPEAQDRGEDPPGNVYGSLDHWFEEEACHHEHY